MIYLLMCRKQSLLNRRAILKRREYLSNLTIRRSLREQRTERPGNAEQGCRPPLLSAPQVAPQDTCTIQPPLPGQPSSTPASWRRRVSRGDFCPSLTSLGLDQT